MGDARRRAADLAALLQQHLGDELIAVYLFGSLAAGAFVEGRSDLDLFAVVESDLDDERIGALRELHAAYVAAHPEWEERVEVAYVSRRVLGTLGGSPAGRLVVISPGEPLHATEVDRGWAINWHSACTGGETLLGPPPLELGPVVTPAAYKLAVEAQLEAWKDEVRAPWVAYVPAHQGYVVVTVCRALYGLATGRQTTKERAVAWAAAQYPEWAPVVTDALARHRADVRSSHEATIRFVDQALESAKQSGRRGYGSER